MLHFPLEPGRPIKRSEDVQDPAVCDLALRDRVLPVALLLEDVHAVMCPGAIIAAHTEADVNRLLEAARRVAHRLAAEISA
jgi:hypothetical protein